MRKISVAMLIVAIASVAVFILISTQQIYFPSFRLLSPTENKKTSVISLGQMMNLQQSGSTAASQPTSLSALQQKQAAALIDVSSTASSAVVKYPGPSQLSYEQALEMALADDACRLALNFVNRPAMAKIIAQAPDLVQSDKPGDRLIENLFSEQVPDDLDPLSKIILHFYNALYKANLMDGLTPPQTDEQAAIIALHQLSTIHPENGVFQYMLAAVLSQQKASDDQIKTALKKAMDAPTFDTYTSVITRRIHEKSYASSSYYILALGLIYDLPIPQIAVSHALIKNYLDSSDPEFRKSAVRFSQRLMDQKIPADADYEFVHWSVLHYAYGASLFKKAWPLAYPGQPLPLFRPTRDIIKQSQKRLDEKFTSAPLIAPADRTTCQREKFAEHVHAEHRKYMDYIRTLASSPQ